MVLIIRKSEICSLALTVVMAVMTVNLAKTSAVAPVSSIPTEDKVIVLDAGHGATDGGATGISGAIEKDINLSIALTLKDMLEDTGARVIMTRESDDPIADSKREDMRLRKRIREESDADIFISIHMNKFGESKYKGAQVFYSTTEGSKELGEIIQRHLKDMVNPDNNRVAKSAGDSLYLLRDSSVPAVIVECGFLSNPHEEQLLLQPDYQSKIAHAICAGVMRYFEEE